MHCAHTTIVGFLFTAVCASFCPMYTGAMAMDHSDMKAMHGMQADASEQADAGCEYCDNHDITDAIIPQTAAADDAGSFTAFVTPAMLITPDIVFSVAYHPCQSLAISKPPDIAFIRTVVLRT